MPLRTLITRCALAALLGTTLPSSAGAALTIDAQSLADYGGIATLTITRAGPTASSSESGAAAGISGATSFSIAWLPGGGNLGYPLADPDGLPLYAVDLGALLPGSAPTSLGRYVFDLSQPTAAFDLDDLDLDGPAAGDFDELLALIDADSDRSAWTGSANRGIFTAHYRLMLFDVPEGILAMDLPGGGDAVATAVPEPGVLALVGIGLLGIGISLRRR
ncbi:PEP-CTERM sorting domain-containing protein [Aromatoleum petrolei]|uniref:PEP-CTERM sorting domain-containing protein n=1 Tax=Aromatoleum petrolei TaxID=76116 RepID=A0ABX1MR72_9RHOO|nr:PEP-CTERM sorting domain-containing protein [Aromatoleum petrolei]NMF89191.1 PEP-CTERM sorting domain-containing protein [Aromatoleum petrolei]QTQ36491.1 Uncharacterized protein ToN1_23500 [Aromatoleum petrolei]